MKRIEHIIDYCCLSLLQSLHHYARWLGIFNSPVRLAPPNSPKRFVRLERAPLRRRLVTFTLRVCALFCFWQVHLPALGRQLGRLTLDAFFAALPVLSVSFLACFALIMQLQLEMRGECMVRGFLHIFQTVREHTATERLFCSRYLAWLMLKFTFTLLGYVDELPTLLAAAGTGMTLLSHCCGVYLWLGSLLLLDACFVGFVTAGAVYSLLGEHLARLMERMRRIGARRHLSDYQRMELLCQCADRLEACNALWTELYRTTLRFHRMHEWQTLYYVLYNFLQILMLLHRSIWTYLHVGVFEPVPFVMIAVKMGNLSLLVMCVDSVLRETRVPDALPLDLIYSGVDGRWDRSVETFFARRQVENLRFRILGFFELRNELLPLILSSIISYLFIMIQFGVETDYKPGGGGGGGGGGGNAIDNITYGSVNATASNSSGSGTGNV